MFALTVWGFAVIAAQQDAVETVVVPLNGLAGRCCERPVEEALGKIDNVKSAKLVKSKGQYRAEIAMKSGHALALSAIEKALDAANRAMGDQMGTQYAMDESLSLAAVHLFKTKAEPDPNELKEALTKLPGFTNVWTCKNGFGVVFEGETLPSVADVRKASRADVTDVLLAASRDGKRYYCPMHPDKAAAQAMACPVCKMKLVEVRASKTTGR